jgi:C-terminal processing protease CtpA/Prc
MEDNRDLVMTNKSEVITMADNKNMELNDEMMANAAGGNGGEIAGPKYEIGDTVQLKFANDEGVVTTVTGVVDDRRFNPGGWEYLVRYEVNGNVYEHWYPEIAL